MSNRWLFNVAVFAAGAVTGSWVTWKIIKTKYEQLAQEEIDSVKEMFRLRNQEENESPDREIIQAYKDIVEGYVVPEERSALDNVVKKPRVISPEELGDCDYEIVTLTYYADGVLADDCDDPITNVDDVVGKESLTCFGRYEDDAVHVRNDERQVDYEILAREENYLDVVNKNPRFTEGK